MAFHFRLSQVTLTTNLAALTFAVACSSAPAPAPGPTGGGKQVDLATTGTLSGRVAFSGTPPTAAILKMASDPACVQESGPTLVSDAVLIGANGALKNAFIYVKDGLDAAYSFDVPTSPAILDQKGCRYTPRIIGVRVGQPLEVINSDATLHNVHAMPMVNREFNHSQPIQGFRTTKTFTKPEAMVLFKCNVHAWMTAYVGVMAHPYFAITDDAGAFEIKNVPPGTYTIEAWHEKFGTQTAKVTLGDKQAQTVSFKFSTKAENPELD